MTPLYCSATDRDHPSVASGDLVIILIIWVLSDSAWWVENENGSARSIDPLSSMTSNSHVIARP